MTITSNARTIKGIVLASVWLALLYTALQRSSDTLQVMGRYSKSLFILIVVYTVISLIVTVVTVRPPASLLKLGGQITRPKVWPIAFIALTAILWLITVVQPETKIFPTVILLLVVWLLTINQPASRISSRTWMIVGGLLILALVVQVLVLLDVPSVHVHDEGAYSRIAFDYFRTGLLSGDIYGYPPRHFIGFGWWLITLAYWYKIFGFGWWVGRMYSFVISCLALPFIYAAASRYFRSWISGAASVGFMAVTSTFVEVHHVRPDAPMIFMLSVCLFLLGLVHEYPQQRYWAFLLGLFAVLALEVHLIALAFWAAFGGFLGLQWLWQLYMKRRFSFPTQVVFYVLGGILPAVFFYVTHLLPDRGLPSEIVLSPSGFDVIHILTKELSRWNEFIYSYPLEALLSLVAVVCLLRRPDSRVLLGIFGLSLAAYLFIAPTEWPQYTRYFLPFQALCIGGVFATQTTIKPALAGVAFAALLGMLFSVSHLFQMTHSPTQKPIPPVVQYVSDHVPPGSTVFMNMVYYLSFDRGDRYRYINTGIYPPNIARFGGPPENEVWASFKPDIIVVDHAKDEFTPWLEQFLTAAHYVKLDRFATEGIEMYVPPNSSLATNPN